MHCIARGFAEVRLAGEHGQWDCTVLHRLARPSALEPVVDGAVHGTAEFVAITAAIRARHVRVDCRGAVDCAVRYVAAGAVHTADSLVQRAQRTAHRAAGTSIDGQRPGAGWLRTR